MIQASRRSRWSCSLTYEDLIAKQSNANSNMRDAFIANPRAPLMYTKK